MQHNDVIIRADQSEFVITSAATHGLIAGPFETFHAALRAARGRAGAHAIWLQPGRQDGQPLEDPVRLPRA